MKKQLDVKTFSIASLRRSSYRWPNREAARRLAKVGRNQYVCATCKKIFTRKETKIDHIIPVVPLEGWLSLDSFAHRLFCEIENFQVLCVEHHKIKTKEEGIIRKKHRDAKKLLLNENSSDILNIRKGKV